MIESIYGCWGCGEKGEFVDAELRRKIRTESGEITHLKLYFKCSCGRNYGETFQFRWHQGGELPPYFNHSCKEKVTVMDKEIDFFIREEEYGWLSNFDRTPFYVDGELFKTNEHYYQSQKANDPAVREYIKSAPHARIAMVLGRQLERNKYLQKYMVDDWDSKKLDVMLKGLIYKFMNPRLRNLLLKTEDWGIHEGNPEDLFWGKDGKDWLGRLIMQVRTEIRSSLSKAGQE